MIFEEISVGESKEIPARIALYGTPKIGKSRFASNFPDAFFVNIEGGLSYLGKKARSTPQLKSYDDVIAWLKHIYENDDFTAGTLVVDSLDWLEQLAQARLVKAHNAQSITDAKVKDFAYNNGVTMAASDTITALKWLDAIYEKKGIKTVLIAHSQVKSIDLPNQDAYSRHELKLSKGLSSKVMEWADLILFADYSFHVSTEGKTSDPKPVLYTGQSCAFLGGGRMQLKKEIPLSYDALVNEITKG